MERTTDNAIFEGLFGRALKPEGSFADELRAIGYDPKRPEIRYPARVWLDALEVARRHCYPQLSPEEGRRELGRRFAEGFFDTITGRFMGAAMSLLDPVDLLRKLPKYWSVGSTGVEVETRQEGERRWRAIYRGEHPVPDFAAGVIEAVGRFTKLQAVVEVPVREADCFELLIRW